MDSAKKSRRSAYDVAATPCNFSYIICLNFCTHTYRKTQDRRKGKELVAENIIVSTTTEKKPVNVSLCLQNYPLFKYPLFIFQKTLSPLQLCFCGALATIFGDFIMHPIDTIKIVQQASGGNNDIINIWQNTYVDNSCIIMYPFFFFVSRK